MRCVRATVVCAHRRDIITQDHIWALYGPYMGPMWPYVALYGPYMGPMDPSIGRWVIAYGRAQLGIESLDSSARPSDVSKAHKLQPTGRLTR